MKAVMDIAKKNLVSIICAVVALIAIALHFYPISGWFTDLQTRVGARAGVYNQLRDLLNKERHLPLVSLEPGAQPARLEQFPTERAIARGTEVKAKIEAEAQAMLKAAVALNQEGKKPLTAGVLPQSTRNDRLIAFRQDYIREWDFTSADPARRAASMPNRTMNAGVRPSEQDILAESKRRTDLIMRQEMAYDDRGRPLNEPQVKAKIGEAIAVLPQQMRAQAADQLTVYVDPESFTISQRITAPGPAPHANMIFWAQVGLWLQEDVCRAIADANSSAKDVKGAVVKRLVSLQVPEQFVSAAASTAQQGDGSYDDGSGAGMVESADLSQPITPNYGVSPTGRFSNPLYDVMQFQMSLIVDADHVPQVLQSLSRNRFITAYETNILAVDSGIEQAEGYIYGPEPVVRMDLRCEALFLREWLTQYMPFAVRRSLGIPDEVPQQ